MATNKEHNEYSFVQESWYDALENMIEEHISTDKELQLKMLDDLRKIDESSSFIKGHSKDKILSDRITDLLEKVLNKVIPPFITYEIEEGASGVNIRIYYYNQSDNKEIQDGVSNLNELLQSNGEKLSISPITTKEKHKYIDIMIPSDGKTRIAKYIDATEYLSVGKQRLDIMQLRSEEQKSDITKFNDTTKEKKFHNKSRPYHDIVEQTKGSTSDYNNMLDAFRKHQNRTDQLFDEAIEAVGRVNREPASVHVVRVQNSRKKQGDEPSTPGF